MSTFETALKFWWGPLSGGGLRRLPHLPHSKSAPGHILKFYFQCYSHNICSRTKMQARVQGRKIEKQKKVIRANFKVFHLYFATF